MWKYSFFFSSEDHDAIFDHKYHIDPDNLFTIYITCWNINTSLKSSLTLRRNCNSGFRTSFQGKPETTYVYEISFMQLPNEITNRIVDDGVVYSFKLSTTLITTSSYRNSTKIYVL